MESTNNPNEYSLRMPIDHQTSVMGVTLMATIPKITVHCFNNKNFNVNALRTHIRAHESPTPFRFLLKWFSLLSFTLSTKHISPNNHIQNYRLPFHREPNHATVWTTQIFKGVLPISVDWEAKSLERWLIDFRDKMIPIIIYNERYTRIGQRFFAIG